MAKDETEIGITGKPIPKKKRSPKKQYEFEKKRRENLGQNVGGRTYSSDVNPYLNPRSVREEVLVDYLLGEGFASDEKSAQAIAGAMSEEWKQSIVEGGINFSVPSRIDDFNNRRDELKNRYKQDVGPRIPGPGGGGQYGEPSAPKATGVRLARGTSSSNRGTETKNNA